jgi:hypothetical protein
MVHALEKTQRLIEPSAGYLIDLHPRAEAVQVEVLIDDQIHPMGSWFDETRFDAYRMADQALAQAVASGWYTLEEEQQFIFAVYADAIADLNDYLVEEGDPRYQEMNSQLVQPIEQLLAMPGGKKEIRLKRPIGICRLRSK